MTRTVEASVIACLCGHPPADHDPIAARYCRATAAGSLVRSCICKAHLPVDFRRAEK